MGTSLATVRPAAVAEDPRPVAVLRRAPPRPRPKGDVVRTATRPRNSRPSRKAPTSAWVAVTLPDSPRCVRAKWSLTSAAARGRLFPRRRKVGPTGRVIGVDMTPEMISRSRSLARAHGRTNVEFRLGEIEHLPVADASVDVVLSNCVINLVPDKGEVYREAFRVLPRRRQLVADVLATASHLRRTQERPGAVGLLLFGSTDPRRGDGTIALGRIRVHRGLCPRGGPYGGVSARSG